MAMKTNFFIRPIFLSLFLMISVQTLTAQQAASAAPTMLDTSKIKYNSISNGCKLVAFPAKNQSQQKQKEDEYACYNWAKEQSGIDPLNLPKVEAPPPQTGPTGAAVGGAAKGAAAGVAIGAIACHWCRCRWIGRTTRWKTGAGTTKPAGPGKCSKI
jgi:hypothetical protein